MDRPKRKRGRPAKKVVHEDKQENLEYAEAANVENCEDEKSEDEIGTDGRKKRKIRAPARFDGLVQVTTKEKQINKLFYCTYCLFWLKLINWHKETTISATD